jgi:Fe(3+) dicitrate transport protein
MAHGSLPDHRAGAALPGLGLTYEIDPDVAVFAGVPGLLARRSGQPDGVRPELSWNYEVGMRYGRTDTASNGQLAFFLSDYENITGSAPARAAAPELVDRMFNGDRATILGIEAEGTHTFEVDELSLPAARHLHVDVDAPSRLASSRTIPSSATSRSAITCPTSPSISSPRGSVGASSGARRERALRGRDARRGLHRPVPGGGRNRRAVLPRRMASVEIFSGIRLYVRGENILDVRPVVSYRPYGLRTGRPFLFQGGLEASF